MMFMTWMFFSGLFFQSQLQIQFIEKRVPSMFLKDNRRKIRPELIEENRIAKN